MHEVVLMAVRKAVSAATITFTANSMIRCFFIHKFPFFQHELPLIAHIIFHIIIYDQFVFNFW